MLHGLVGKSVLAYQLGLFDGAVDGGSLDFDNNHAKDFAGRVFVKPLAWDPRSVLANLGVGIAGTIGNQRGTAAVPSLPSYRSIGQQTFLSFIVNDAAPDSTVVARGLRTRLSPQGYFYCGPVGLLAEYIQSRQHVEKGADSADLTVRAWQVAGYLVLGGKPGYEGPTVTAPFDPKKRTWGALELAARYNELSIDDAAFPIYADLTNVAKRARAAAAVATWHWSRIVSLRVQYEHTWFEGGAKDGDRHAENALLQMIQAAF